LKAELFYPRTYSKLLPIEIEKFGVDSEDWLNREYLDDVLGVHGEAGVLLPADVAYLQELRGRAFFITGERSEKVLSGVRNSISEGLRTGEPMTSIVSNIQTTMRTDREAYARTIARTNASDAYNTGRMNTYTSDRIRPFVESYQYLAILDDRTTLFCEDHNDQIIKANDPRLGMITPPNHFNCRSMLNAVLTGERDIPDSEYYLYNEREPEWGTGVPVKSQMPGKGFGGR